VAEHARAVDFPDLLNVRDLGGCPTTDGAETRWRSLLRADDLAQLTPQGLRAFADYGICTILDLRWPEESRRYPCPVTTTSPHVQYEHIPLLTPTEDEWRLRSREPAKELWKCAVLEHARAELRDVLAFIAAARPGPLLFHCVAGKDRTGLLAALLLALADVQPQAIAADYALSAQMLREGYLRRYPDIESTRILEALRCPEEGVYNMLSFLETAGGVLAYLAQLGLSQAEIARLRARLRS
jgi:protein-tyrosine phosphatase